MKLLSWISKLFLTVILVCIISITTTFVMVNLYTQQLLSHLGIQTEESELTFAQFISHLTGQGEPLKEKDEINVEPPAMDAAVEVWNEQSVRNQEIDTEEEKSIVISLDDFNRTKDLLTNEDKMSIFSIVISNIPAKEVQRFSSIMEEGITQEELHEIEEMMELYLDEADYEQLISILNRYE